VEEDDALNRSILKAMQICKEETGLRLEITAIEAEINSHKVSMSKMLPLLEERNQVFQTISRIV
jgi:hypothetical protein